MARTCANPGCNIELDEPITCSSCNRPLCSDCGSEDTFFDIQCDECLDNEDGPRELFFDGRERGYYVPKWGRNLGPDQIRIMHGLDTD